MATLEAKTTPLVVDRDAGETDATTSVRYEKHDHEVLWLRSPGTGWFAPNVFVLTGEATAEQRGTFFVRLAPGEIQDVAVFQEGRPPIEEQVVQTRAEAFLKVFCLLKAPEARTLVTDRNEETGGTWHARRLHTDVMTSLVMIGASRQPPYVDPDGMPHLVHPDGGPAFPGAFTDDHAVELRPLLPGHHYFLAAVVADVFGNWEAVIAEFDTLKRQVTVGFPTLHVYDDGDPHAHGEASFRFRVMHPPVQQPTVLRDFERPMADIDDWNETDRPYPLGYSYQSALAPVRDGEQQVWVASWGTEEDGIGESDEAAGNWGEPLSIPSGRGLEDVPHAHLLLDCPSTTDDDFHYGVEVTWSVVYLP